MQGIPKDDVALLLDVRVVDDRVLQHDNQVYTGCYTWQKASELTCKMSLRISTAFGTSCLNTFA